MGLDITAYSKIAAAKGNEAFDDTGELKYDDGWVRFCKNEDFPHAAEDIRDGCAYKYDESFSFRAGSYGGYNSWRDQLAELAGYPPTKTNRGTDSYAAACWQGAVGPFSELINFSHCEGVIGADVSAKLATDFAEFQPKADNHPDDYFRERYSMWRKAFEMAANCGAVDFH